MNDGLPAASLAALAAFTAGCAGFGAGATPTPPPTPDVSAAIVWASGKVVPARRANLSFGVGGRLAGLTVEEGAEVAEGDLLAYVDAPELESAAQQAGAALALAEARRARIAAGARPEEVGAAREAVAAAQAQAAAARAELGRAAAARGKVAGGPSDYDLALARIEVDRARDRLYGAQAQRDTLGGALDRGEAVQAQVDLAEAAVLEAEDAVRAAELAGARLAGGPDRDDLAAANAQVGAASAAADAAAAAVRQTAQQLRALEAGATAAESEVADAEVRQARAAHDAAREALEGTELRAPFAGTVGAVSAQVGETLAPGQAVVSLGDLDGLRVETADLRETDIARVEAGQAVDITFDSLPDVTLPGRVARIAPMASVGQGGTNYTVWVAFDRVDPRLRWGMTAYANIHVRR